MLLKLASCGQMMDIQSYLTVADNITLPEQSNVVYYKVLHQRCDNKGTLLNVINDIYAEFVATGKRNIIFLEGDQATYERLQSIKREYLQDFSWMIPFPGDWHMLKNYQEVLLKIYFDAGFSCSKWFSQTLWEQNFHWHKTSYLKCGTPYIDIYYLFFYLMSAYHHISWQLPATGFLLCLHQLIKLVLTEISAKCLLT